MIINSLKLENETLQVNKKNKPKEFKEAKPTIEKEMCDLKESLRQIKIDHENEIEEQKHESEEVVKILNIGKAEDFIRDEEKNNRNRKRV